MLPLPVLEAGLPPAPPAELDPYLDAAARCLARHGIGRTSVQDVARELGVNRATVYRQVGTVEDMVRLLVARELTPSPAPSTTCSSRPPPARRSSSAWSAPSCATPAITR